MAEDDDVMRICLSTDNHLGYKERDPVRGMDSFAGTTPKAQGFIYVLCILTGVRVPDNGSF